MDEKIYDLLEKLYIDMQDIKDRMATKEDIMLTRQEIVRLENKMDINFKALYDGYQQSIEGIKDLGDKLDKLADRVDNQEIKLQVFKSVK